MQHPSPTILDRIGNTPMVRLVRVAAGLPVPVLGKCEFLNPGGSVKDRIALAILDAAESKGLLRSGATLVEATAGTPASASRWWRRSRATVSC